jgi:hypothetical protein
MRKQMFIFCLTILGFLAFSFPIGAANNSAQTHGEENVLSVPLPGGSAGIGFDDLRYSATLNKVLIPAGRTGLLVLLDPEKHDLTEISGFSAQEAYGGGHGEGITSVDEGRGLLFVTDRSSLKLHIVNPASKKIVSSTNLASSPDYVRFVAVTNEVWVTEPDRDQIEVFSLNDKPNSSAVHSGFVQVKGGPESLVIDGSRAVGYSNLWKDKTVAVDLKSKKVVSTWPNTCQDSRGLAFDQKAGVLFVGCAEGKAISMDILHNGKIISTVTSGSGVDIVDYNTKTKHLYFPGAKSGTMAIIAVSPAHTLSVLGTLQTVNGAHCVISDSTGNLYVCDPHHGKILVLHDTY